MKFNLSDNIKFSKISGDKNKIHIESNCAKKFFFKKPIAHGANILINTFKRKNNFNQKFNYLEILFKDYVNIGEEIKVIKRSNKTLVKGEFNEKIQISKKLLNNNQTIKKIEITKELIFISRYIGNISPGPNSLIQQITFCSSNIYNSKRHIKIRTINKNVKIITYFYKYLKVEIVAIKLIAYKKSIIKNFPIKKKILKKIKNKKILIYGKNSDIGNFLYNSKFRKICEVKILSSLNLDYTNLKKDLEKIKPDYIFYFLSPRILSVKNQKVYNNYKNVYINIPKKIYNILTKFKKKFRIFYPSTIFINEQKKYKHLQSYILAKKKAEYEFKKKIYKNTFFITRLPMLKTRSNYNPYSGKYMGEDLNYLFKVLLKFL
mgnify:CR=1 FL=1